ncbi:hypothetical protein PISL3812_05104 [Talaromyces islandicus]|uniref:Uncharacterized protein n=1 Tax=Talaromyces islandicus TaxID=28573 RepID=A0A0U1LXI0_TALIS|nr:hypothetical protein PISL3812_05104 [Talaromyces islandicus]
MFTNQLEPRPDTISIGQWLDPSIRYPLDKAISVIRTGLYILFLGQAFARARARHLDSLGGSVRGETRHDTSIFISTFLRNPEYENNLEVRVVVYITVNPPEFEQELLIMERGLSLSPPLLTSSSPISLNLSTYWASSRVNRIVAFELVTRMLPDNRSKLAVFILGQEEELVATNTQVALVALVADVSETSKEASILGSCG